MKKLLLFIFTIIILSSCTKKNKHVNEEDERPKDIVQEAYENFNPQNFNMIYVEGGIYTMGKKDYDNFFPHEVIVDSFYISDIEVTQYLFNEIMGYVTTKEDIEDFINNPAIYVSWLEAVEFCNKLSKRDGFTPCYTINDKNVTCDFYTDGYRLPTEAEWEYAARGGKLSQGYEYSGSNDLIEVAWSPESYEERNVFPFLMVVGLKKTNELGLYDMSGNVYEWCWDWYDENYYEKSPINNPHGPAKFYANPKWFGDVENGKVLRGGSYLVIEQGCDVYRRSFSEFDKQLSECGLRICQTYIEKK